MNVKLEMRYMLLVVSLILCYQLTGLLATNSTNSKRKLYIGGFFPLNDAEWVGTEGILLGAQLAIKHVNEDPKILRDYELNLFWNGTKSSVPYGLKILYEYIYHEPTKIMLIGAGYSSVTEPIAETSKLWNLVQFSYGATSPSLSNRAKFSNFFRTIPSDASMNAPRVAILKYFDWKKVGLIYQAENIFAVTMDELTKMLQKENITVLESAVFTDNPQTQVQQLKKSDARVIIASFYEKAGRDVLCEAYHEGLRGEKYVWIMLGWLSGIWWHQEVNTGRNNCTKEQMIEMVDGYLATDAVSYYPSHDTLSPIKGQDVQGYMLQHNITTDQQAKDTYGYANFAYDAIYAMAVALNNTHNQLKPGKWLSDFTYEDANLTKMLRDNCYKVNFTGITGPIAFNKNGGRVGIDSISQLQYINGQPHKVITGLYYDATNEIRWTNRTIKWAAGKVPRDSTLVTRRLESVTLPVYIVMSILASMGTVLAFFFAFINNYFRKNSSIKISSPRLNNIIVIGSVVLYATVYVLGLTSGDARPVTINDLQYSAICTVKTWLPVFGFTLGFGALFAKTYRVYKIFKNKKLKVALWALTDIHLLGGVAVLALADLILLSVWQGVDPLLRVTKDLPEQIIGNNSDAVVIPVVEICTSRDFSIWLTILYTYKGLLLAAGLYLAWETRKVSIEALNDSRYIGVSVYNVVILCTICIPLSTILETNPTASFILMSVFIVFCTTATLCLVFVPKVAGLKRVNIPQSQSYPFPFSDQCGSVFIATTTVNKEGDLQSKIRRLEASLRKKETMVSQLKKMLQKEGIKYSGENVNNINCVTDYTDYDEKTDPAQAASSSNS